MAEASGLNQSRFARFSRAASHRAGHPVTFAVAVAVVLAWSASGPIFGFSDTWQLVINTGTTIVTFLMVFLIQNTQNRDAIAMHLKLDELIRVSRANNTLLDMEELSEGDLILIRDHYEALAAKARKDPRVANIEEQASNGSSSAPQSNGRRRTRN